MKQGWRPIVFIFLLATLIRLGYWYLNPPAGETIDQLTKDAHIYSVYAVNLLEQRTFVYGREYALRTPGYPVFLAFLFFIFGKNLLVVRLVQIFLDGVSCLLIYKIARKHLGNNYALFLGILAASFGGMIRMTTEILTETFFTFLLSLFLFVFYRRLTTQQSNLTGYLGGKNPLLLPALLTLLVLVRPDVLLLPLFLAVYFVGLTPLEKSVDFSPVDNINEVNRQLLLPEEDGSSKLPLTQSVRERSSLTGFTCPAFDRRLLGRVGIFLLLFLCLLSPWVIRNYFRLGSFIPGNSNGGFTFHQGTYVSLAKLGADREPIDYSLAKQYPEVEKDQQYYRKGWELFNKQPLYRKLLLPLINVAFLFYPFLPEYDLTFGFILPFALWGILLVCRSRRSPFFPLVLILLYYLLLCAVFHGSPRYRYPLSPILLLLAVYSISHLLKKGKGMAIAGISGWFILNLFLYWNGEDIRLLLPFTGGS